MLFLRFLFFAKYRDAADKLNPALINSDNSFFKTNLSKFSFFCFSIPFSDVLLYLRKLVLGPKLASVVCDGSGRIDPIVILHGP